MIRASFEELVIGKCYCYFRYSVYSSKPECIRFILLAKYFNINKIRVFTEGKIDNFHFSSLGAVFYIMNYSLKLEQLEIGKCYQDEGYEAKFILLGKTKRMFGESLKIFVMEKL